MPSFPIPGLADIFLAVFTVLLVLAGSKLPTIANHVGRAILRLRSRRWQEEVDDEDEPDPAGKK